MPIGAVTAAVGVAGVGASIYGANKASKAAGKAADAQTQAAADANAEQAREFNYVQQQNEPFRQIGLSSAQALAGGFGLPVSMTGQQPAANSNVGTSGLMTGTTGASYAPTSSGAMTTKVPGGFAGTSPTLPASGSNVVSMTGQPVSPTAATTSAQPDYAAYVQQWPDLLNLYNAQQGLAKGKSMAQFGQEHYQLHGQAEGRTVPGLTTTAPTPAQPGPAAAPAPAAGGAPAGYTDPTAPSGYTTGPRPTVAPYVAPALDVSVDTFKTQSPDYAFGLSQGQAALDHVASAGGGLMSGARLKAATRYGEDYATTKYDGWRDYTTGQYNTDRNFNYTQQQNTQARSDGLYQDDRAYTTGRYDTRNNQLMQLAGFGTGANASNASAASSYATNVGNNLMTAGNAQANGYINSANATTSAVNNGLTIAGNLAGRYMTSGYGSGGTTSGFGATGGYAGSTDLLNYG